MTSKQRIGLALLLLAVAFYVRGGGAIGRDIADDGLYVLIVAMGVYFVACLICAVVEALL